MNVAEAALDREQGTVEVVRIETTCKTVDDVVAKFHPFCEGSSLFVMGAEARGPGQVAPFELRLVDDTAALSGWCTVLNAWTDSANPFGRPGVRFALHRLTPASQQVLHQLRVARAKASRIASVLPGARSQTRLGIPILGAQDGPTERMKTPPAGVLALGLADPADVADLGASTVVAPTTPLDNQHRTKGIRIATPCATLDEFIAAFHRCCEENAFFIAAKTLRPVGLQTAFSVDLTDGSPMLRGLGVVLDAWASADNRFKRPGVLIGIERFTADSKPVFEQLLIARAVTVDEQRANRDRKTRQFVALGTPVAPPPSVASPVTIASVPAEVHDEPSVIVSQPVVVEPVTPPPAAPTPPVRQRVATPPPLPVVAPPAPSAAEVGAEVIEELSVPVLIEAPPLAVEVEAPAPPAPPVVVFAPPAVVVAPPAVVVAPPPAVAAVPAIEPAAAVPVMPHAPQPRRRWLAPVVFVVGAAMGLVGGWFARESQIEPAPAASHQVVTVPVPVATEPKVDMAAAQAPAPTAAEPAATEPAATQPAATEPAATEPAATPTATEPAVAPAPTPPAPTPTPTPPAPTPTPTPAPASKPAAPPHPVAPLRPRPVYHPAPHAPPKPPCKELNCL